MYLLILSEIPRPTPAYLSPRFRLCLVRRSLGFQFQVWINQQPYHAQVFGSLSLCVGGEIPTLSLITETGQLYLGPI